MLFNDDIFKNVYRNYYHQEPETWYMSMKIFLITSTYYISLRTSWKLIFNEKVFENGCLYIFDKQNDNYVYK